MWNLLPPWPGCTARCSTHSSLAFTRTASRFDSCPTMHTPRRGLSETQLRRGTSETRRYLRLEHAPPSSAPARRMPATGPSLARPVRPNHSRAVAPRRCREAAERHLPDSAAPARLPARSARRNCRGFDALLRLPSSPTGKERRDQRRDKLDGNGGHVVTCRGKDPVSFDFALEHDRTQVG
jgi:hypothetical protein